MGREHHAGIERQQQQKQTAATRNRPRPPGQRIEAPGPAMGALASPRAILALQRTVGNAAVNQLLRQQEPATPLRRIAAANPARMTPPANSPHVGDIAGRPALQRQDETGPRARGTAIQRASRIFGTNKSIAKGVEERHKANHPDSSGLSLAEKYARVAGALARE